MIFNHITSCEHFQQIKSILELYPDDETNSTPPFTDRSDHWSFLLFKESLAIRRFQLKLNHGTIKAPKVNIISSIYMFVN